MRRVAVVHRTARAVAACENAGVEVNAPTEQEPFQLSEPTSRTNAKRAFDRRRRGHVHARRSSMFPAETSSRRSEENPRYASTLPASPRQDLFRRAPPRQRFPWHICKRKKRRKNAECAGIRGRAAASSTKFSAKYALNNLRYSDLNTSRVSASPLSSIAWIDFFEFGKHRLAKERAANVVDLAVDDVGAHFRVARFAPKDNA